MRRIHTNTDERQKKIQVLIIGDPGARRSQQC